MLLIVNVAKDGWRLNCWSSGGKHILMEPPELPFFWAHPVNTRLKAEIKHCRRRLLSDPKKVVDVDKVICSTVWGVMHEREIVASMEDQVRFKERLAQDYGFVQKDTAVSHTAFDIEASSSGQFPRADRDPITAIAVYNKDFKRAFASNDEADVIAKTIEAMKKTDGDVVDTFSGTAFDYDFPTARARVHGAQFAIGRWDDTPYTKVRTFQMGMRKGVDKTTFLHGRLCFDIYKEAAYDPALSGVRHGLKDIGRFFFPDIADEIIEVDRARLKTLSEQELADYCLSDAKLTWMLGEHYLNMLKPVAKLLMIPFDMVIHRSPSHIGNLIYGRGFNKLGIVSDGSNVERHAELLGLMPNES